MQDMKTDDVFRLPQENDTRTDSEESVNFTYDEKRMVEYVERAGQYVDERRTAAEMEKDELVYKRILEIGRQIHQIRYEAMPRETGRDYSSGRKMTSEKDDADIEELSLQMSAIVGTKAV